MPKQHHCPRCKSTVNSKCISRRHVVRCPTHLSFNEKGRKCPACKAEEERNEARTRKERQALRDQQPIPEEKIRKGTRKAEEKVGKGDPSKRRGADESHTVSQQAGSGDHNASTLSNNTLPPGVPELQGNQAYGLTAPQGGYGKNDSYSQDWAAITHEQQSIVGDTHDNHICGGHSHHTQDEADNHSSNSDHDHTPVQHGSTLSEASQGTGDYTTDYTPCDINGYSNTQLSSVQKEDLYWRNVPRGEEESAYTDNGADDFAAGDIHGYDGEDAQHVVAQEQDSDEVHYDYGVNDADYYDSLGRNQGFGYH